MGLLPLARISAEPLEQVLAQAKKQRLSEQPTWHALLHYEKNFNNTWTSLIDDDEFFLSQDGKQNPSAELLATLEAFFSETVVREQHSQCAFRARFEWLASKLPLEDSLLKSKNCARFEEWFQAIQPRKATLIFPTSYLNNPSSAFGHTLLRLDQSGQTDNSKLLAYTANYAATTQPDNALIYAMRGLFGGYSGYFSNEPYYKKIRQYSDLENRDVWEYELTLTEEEVRRLTLHLWELRGTRLDYFYLKENCSYLLLRLIMAGRPTLDLTSHYFWWAIPIDTVRTVVDAGLVRSIHFRPSQLTTLMYRLPSATNTEKELARKIAHRQISPTDEAVSKLLPEQRIRTLELSYDYFDYLRSKHRDDSDEAKSLAFSLLKERSQITMPSTTQNVPTPSIRPDQGHKTARIRIGTGQQDSKLFSEIEIRPAYHDLLDPAPGYLPGAEIQFLNLGFRHYETHGLRLETITPLRIQSLSPRNKLLRPWSWQVELTGKRKAFEKRKEPLIPRLIAGSGVTQKLSQKLTAYAMLRGGLELSGNLRKNFALGYGPEVGLLGSFGERYGLQITLNGMRFGWGAAHNTYFLRLEQRYSLTPQLALRAGATQQQGFKTRLHEIFFAFDLYL